MCGISGIINFDKKPVNESSLKEMMQIMKHRGPDDSGSFIDDYVGLGFVRLSIIDLSIDGHQPMLIDDGNLVIVFNGEIYNYTELQEELKHEFKFSTKTDTEVILKAYQKWGKECLDKFNGMFAFAIYDKRNNEIFIARDRFGIKPFYYYLDENCFVFCSEIPPILNATKEFYKPEPNNQAIYDFLVYNRTNHNENTFFDKIKKLQHSHSISIKGNNFIIDRWYNLKERVSQIKKTNRSFIEYFKESLKYRLRSDVPIGACFSGGLDSSSIVSSLIKEFNFTELNTFSAIYEKGQKGDESTFISQYNGIVKNMHFIYPKHTDLLNELNDFIECMQEPVPGTSAFAEYKVYQLAKDHVTVILNGQGADETLAGYLYFAGFYYKELLKQGKLINLVNEMILDYKNHKSIEGHTAFLYFMLPSILKDKTLKNKNKYIDNTFAKSYKGDSSFIENLYGSSSLKESMINHFEYKFEHHLIWGDRSSMWFSMESRYPFLDHDLVEMLLSLPNDEVLKNGVTKVALRNAMLDIVPESIRLRMDKVGYETPEDNWFRTPELIEVVNEILYSTTFKNRGYINPEKAKSLFEKHVSGKINIANEIWKWINLELWFRKFIDK